MSSDNTWTFRLFPRRRYFCFVEILCGKSIKNHENIKLISHTLIPLDYLNIQNKKMQGQL